MSRIDDLISELCPNGVEYQTLGDVGEFIRGNGLQKKDLFDEGYPAIHYGQIHTHYGVWSTKTKSFTSQENAAKLRRARPGDLLIATTSEDDDAVAKATSWLGESEVVLSGDAYIYRHQLDPRYVSYFFQSKWFQDQKKRYISGTKVRRIAGTSLAKIHIPAPPLEVQREIVRILDTFTELEAELNAEREVRLQQYAHYREFLLSFDSAVPKVPLGDFAQVKTGESVSKKSIQENPGVFPVINSGREPLGFISRYNTDDNPIGVTSRGAGVGSITWCEGKYFRGNLNYGITIRKNKEVNVRFLYHSLLMLQSQIQKLCTFQGIPALNKANLEKLLVALPPLEEQARNAAVLDQFDALVNDCSVGLPAELDARRKQYEYYRDKLLTFDEAPA